MNDRNETDLFKVRRGGILLHSISLPGAYGIGSFGEAAYRWVDRLVEGGASIWQVLPQGPTGYGDSPYQCYSAFAGNPLLIDLQKAVEAGWLFEKIAQEDQEEAAQYADYERARSYKLPLLTEAYYTFLKEAKAQDRQDFETFCKMQSDWLEDFALFMAIKERMGGKPWYEWPEELKRRQPEALERIKKELHERIGWHRFTQYLFDRQWRDLKDYANDRGVLIIGDLPIYVAEDSSDVWSHPELFDLDENLRPRHVAGVPPDFFSATGQRWGNPLYDWKKMAADGYGWWMRRIETSMRLYDGVRIDHFRGFEAYWAIPAQDETAVGGRWIEGPGADFFEAVRRRFGKLPFIAEDLGIITPEVETLRDDFGLPGMKILQFAFGGGADNPYLPHNYPPLCVAYTGTHDNDTTIGWYETLPNDQKAHVEAYLSRSDPEPHWALIREAWASVARLAVVPMQDILGLGSWARMNTPGTERNNWRWRMSRAQMEEAEMMKLKELGALYGRSIDGSAQE